MLVLLICWPSKKKNSHLLKLSADGIRMENELYAAREIQLNDFPLRSNQLGSIMLCGFHLSATECAGDWWYYKKVGTHVFLAIGDATGHGFAPALVTGSVRTAMSMLSKNCFSPAEVLNNLNQVLFEFCKGKLGMSLFMSIYNEETKTLHYSTASHPPIYLMKGESMDSKLISLKSPPGSILGIAEGTEYQEGQCQLETGDKLLYFTDGAPETLNPKGRQWGQKRLEQAIYDAFQKNSNVEIASAKIKNSLKEYVTDYTALEDDVTFMLVEVV